MPAQVAFLIGAFILCAIVCWLLTPAVRVFWPRIFAYPTLYSQPCTDLAARHDQTSFLVANSRHGFLELLDASGQPGARTNDSHLSGSAVDGI